MVHFGSNFNFNNKSLILRLSKKTNSRSDINGIITFEYGKKNILEFFLSNETLIRSKFNSIKIGDKINLELPLKYGTKISGHICQGHVDTVAKILNITKIDKSYLFDFEIPKKERNNLIEKASICVNGISLTISKVTKRGFQIWIIPHLSLIHI